jgi:hypothetical protein
VSVTGIHELVANALVMPGQHKRKVNLRLEPMPGVEQDDEEGDDV